MIKIFGKVMYGFFILVIGFIVFTESSYKRIQKFYINTAVENLKNDKYSDFVDDTLLMIGASRYLAEPVYRYHANDLEYKFNLNLYHYQSINGKTVTSGLSFYLFNFEAAEEFDGIQFLFKSNSSNNYAIINIMLKLEEEYLGGNVLDPIVLDISENSNKFKFTYNREVTLLSEIKEIEMKTFKYDKQKDMFLTNDTFAVIKNNNDFTLGNTTNEAQFVRNDNILELTNFTGKLDEYKKLETQYEVSFNEINLSKIKPYSYIVRNALIIYLLCAFVATYLLYFLKPTIIKIKKIKELKKETINASNID